MSKKWSLLLLLLLLIPVGFAANHFNQYTIEDTGADIESALVEWQSKGNSTEFQLKLISTEQLENTNSKIVLFETPDENIGYAHLIKGWNGKYKINVSGWGTNMVSYHDVKTDKGMYGVFIGKNPKAEIKQMTAKLSKQDFDFSSVVPEGKQFIIYKKLPANLKETDLLEIYLYDKNAKEIIPLLN
ncbi:hypothetical protein AC739_17530 [Planococcus glaciei]|uniref:hypothetical protein n=1 Tax=Planococcus glaciei TaxID=459472 RepID=UPI00069DAE0A|nr:hypothetical protein [Planococcus glaciei]KOF08911.1 hypothetical protein AC739_17530 [Planococcus glaciei]